MTTANLRSAPVVLRALTVAILATSSLAACSSDSPTGPDTPDHASVVESGGLRLTVGTDKASYAFGDVVMIETQLKNVSSSPIQLDFARGNPARYPNVNVNVVDGDDLSQYVEGEGDQDMVTLNPGKTISYSFAWDQNSRFTRKPVDRGNFEIVAFVGFDDRDTLKADGLFVELK